MIFNMNLPCHIGAEPRGPVKNPMKVGNPKIGVAGDHAIFAQPNGCVVFGEMKCGPFGGSIGTNFEESVIASHGDNARIIEPDSGTDDNAVMVADAVEFKPTADVVANYDAIMRAIPLHELHAESASRTILKYIGRMGQAA